MLTKCPECDLQVSDKAISCPHCGYPFKPEKISHTKKPKRLPNGFGQITKLKSNLRKPYRAMVTVGKTEYGKPICKLLQPQAYFKTYNEAYEALCLYNRNPYDLDTKNITFKEVYKEWYDKHSAKVGNKSVNGYKIAYKFCQPIYDMKFSNIRIKHLRQVIDQEEVKQTMKSVCKVMFNLLYDYAVEMEYIDKNYAREFSIDAKKPQTKHKISFTEEELADLWSKRQEYPILDAVLIQCYSGWRPSELVDLKLENINLEEGYMMGGMKTSAGKDRKVPIHPAIKPIIEEKYHSAKGSKLLDLKYNTYRNHFSTALPGHTPHDCRKTFVTLAKKYKVDEYAIKRIVGHTITDITEEVYTDRNFEWLKEEMQKIKVNVEDTQ